MPIKAIFFGAIGTLAETSEVQPETFNLAFKQSGLDWVWDRVSYVRMLEGLAGSIPRDRFDYIGDGTRVAARKPAPDIYLDALSADLLKTPLAA